MVEYREVFDFPGYWVGSDGTVWSEKKRGNWIDKSRQSWRQMQLCKRGAYLFVTLVHERKYKTFLVHRLVLLVFQGPPPSDKHLGLHKDDDKENNTPDNLYWGTHQENSNDAKRNGRLTRGEKNGCNRLTEDQAKEVLRLRAEEGIGCRRIAKQLGCHHTTVQAILDGTTWSHLDRPQRKLEFATQGDTIRGNRNPATKIKVELREKIKRLYSSGEFSQQELADIFGIHQTRISSIIRGD